MNKIIMLLLSFVLFTSFSKTISILSKSKAVVVWQPSHQTDTGKDFSEAKTCNGIIEAAMDFKPKLKEFKVWSLNEPNLHHPNVGSNTIIEHTSAVIDGKLSGYAYELQESNKRKPDVFIAVHNNGGTKRHAIWGYIHEGDEFEAENKVLASRLIAAISAVTNLENRGVLFDSSTGRNDYTCKKTGKKGFYSLDENVNTAKYRVLLEVGDNGISKEFLENPANQKKMGQALKVELAKWLHEKGL
ncbi:MAG: N-acetylmuramoyl-L-alanine amidase [Pedobacter sp.]|nr:N-acetylmuramoyl-L-alanine amidase [Pedobacter sp.]